MRVEAGGSLKGSSKGSVYKGFGCLQSFLSYLYVYSCIYVCMYVCMYACMYGVDACMVWMYGCVDVWMYGCMDVCMRDL